LIERREAENYYWTNGEEKIPSASKPEIVVEPVLQLSSKEWPIDGFRDQTVAIEDSLLKALG